MVFDTFKRLVADLVPSGEEIAYLQAAAIKRVLCTSEDFNSLVYTAVNIQAMTEKQVARFILDDDTALRRLEELTKSSDRALATAFSHALAHLLWGGQSAELFVEQRHRHLYSTKTPFPEIRKYSQEPHPLKQMIGSVCGGLNACIKSPGPNPDDLLELQFYFELLQLIIDEQSDIQAFSKWLDRVIRRQPPQQISTPLVICLVADTVHILKTGINSAAASSRLQISPSNIGPVQEVQESGRLEQEREGFFAVQQQRVEAVKRLVGRLGWEMLSAPSSSQPSPGTSVFEIIQEAFSTCSSPSRRHPNEIDVWLLEQALLLSTQNCHGHGLQLVAKSALGLLVSFDEPEDSMPDSTSSQDNQKENRARCAKVLSHSIQVMRDYAGPEEFIQRISPALDKLVDLWARFKDDFNKNPDLNDDTMLSSWLKLRVALDKPEEYGWGPLHQQQFGDAYPSLKLGFDGMALVLQGVETLSDVDQNPAELPRAADFDKQAGQTEPDAVDNGAVQRSDEINNEQHHIFFNDKGFHNHLNAHLLGAYALGCSPEVLSAAYRHHTGHLKPAFRSPGEITENNWMEHVGKWSYYNAYMHFYASQIEAHGPVKTLEKYVFSREANLTPEGNQGPQMLDRFMSGLLHPMIHTGHWAEFGVPGILAEGLALASVTAAQSPHLFPPDFFDYDSQPSGSIKSTTGEATTTVRTLSLDNSRSSSHTSGPHSLDILHRMLQDPALAAGKTCEPHGESMFTDTMKSSGDKIREYAKLWQVNSDREVPAKLEEVAWLSTLVYGLGGWRKGKPFRSDFFL
ncbi:hypothetical protein FRC01_010911 [Tulasnella sp. 417]|nr:hypothetical protein FRC01_010911 [Tulasnella sp. 417]